jgi:NitT/TauT family transport system permease protein
VTAIAATSSVASRPSLFGRIAESRFFAVGIVVIAIIVIWYAGAILLDAPFQRDLDQRRGATVSTTEFLAETLNQKKPTLPSPHQVAVETYKSTILANPTKPSSLIYHAWVTLYSTLVGFAFGTLFGIVLAVGIVHVKSLDKSLMPWIISSQTIPILAIAPMVIVVLAAIGVTGLIPKALISTYLSFFPVTVGMVKGLRSPAPINLDLMRTYNASRWQVFWKLRLPASLPFLFTSMKVAVAAALVGAIVAELPTGAVAGIGAKLLVGSYYTQSVQMWAALVVGSVMAALLVAAVGIIERVVTRRMGARPA